MLATLPHAVRMTKDHNEKHMQLQVKGLNYSKLVTQSETMMTGASLGIRALSTKILRFGSV